MKKIIVTILALVMSLSMAGCVTKDNTDEEVTSGGNRFVTVYSQHKLTNFVYIIRDTETGVDYLYVCTGDGVGLCKLENDDNA